MPDRNRIRSGGKLPPPNPSKPTSRLHTPVGLSFRYAEKGNTCLSVCAKDDVREVVDCLRQLTTMDWQQVLQTGGKGPNKAGLAYTPYPDEALTKSRPIWLAQDVKIASIRGSSSVRVFGAYIDHIFYVIWFDPEHDIVPQNKNRS